ncbi:DUF5695 domain-containing protein [Saccharicrinis sp. FJH54]|uniref:DUF5695 domain-containing protein n=1 Tax=Saccharicrinis sp. FJH54 TaxID=3344665 RepID=UPI0035D42225
MQIRLKYLILILTLTGTLVSAQNRRREKPVPTLGLDSGYTDYSTQQIKLQLVNASQTVSELKTDEGFDFTPHDRLEARSGNRFYHLGDINLRVRSCGCEDWASFSTAENRKPVMSLNVNDPEVLAASNLNGTMPETFPLELTRYWQKKGDHLVLRFKLVNNTDKDVEIGALGIPMIFNNDLTGKSLDEAHAQNVFYDPYIGMDAGYLQVVSLKGEGKVLLVLPWENSPFEAYRPLLDDPTPRGITFEGFHEWMIHSKAWADAEWEGVEQWNTPTEKVLKPGEVYEVGVEFVLADSVKNIEKTLADHNRPVAVGIPGYVLPEDVVGTLFLKAEKGVKSITSEPEGALSVTFDKVTDGNWKKYTVKGNQWGRARLSVTYDDGTLQTINYKVIKPEAEVVADNGHFLTTKQWYENSGDLFDRSPSVITYDYETGEKVLQDSRSWICGLSDEGGAGAWLNAIMKQLVEPDPEEIAKLDSFVNQTLWGGIQYNSGDHKYGVRKSMFYYEPDSMPAGTYRDDINYKTWAAWSKKAAMSVGRSYNYPHVAAAHWVMYRLARNYKGLVDDSQWRFYLENAFYTSMAMVEQAPYYAQFGQMEGTVFLLILNDLRNEGFADMADKLEAAMKKRADHWATLNYPFGSEMPWDSTGQEEVYMWSRYFGFSDKAMVTLKAIMAYMPTIPHWAYNGNARRYWDFLFGGKLSRIERQIHHYGSALNAIPVLHEYRLEPDNLYLLRVGYGGVMGAISNINEEGFAPCAFHSFPSTLANDGISGDYGTGFFGYAVNSATFITRDDDFGWLAFGGNISEDGDWVTTDFTTASKSRLFIAPENLWITLDAGNVDAVRYNSKTHEVILVLAPENDFTPKAFLRLEKDGKPVSSLKKYKKDSRGAWVVPLKKKSVEVKL